MRYDEVCDLNSNERILSNFVGASKSLHSSEQERLAGDKPAFGAELLHGSYIKRSC